MNNRQPLQEYKAGEYAEKEYAEKDLFWPIVLNYRPMQHDIELIGGPLDGTRWAGVRHDTYKLSWPAGAEYRCERNLDGLWVMQYYGDEDVD